MPKTNLSGYARHTISEDDLAAVGRVLQSDSLTSGPMVKEFESQFCNEVGAKYAIACSSGTAALHLAALALELGPGDAVIVPAITFLANMARYVGADVVFADVDPSTGLMTERNLLDALATPLGKKAKAIVNVHLGGQCDRPDRIEMIAKQHGLRVIEDACHAVGTTYFSDCSEEKGTRYKIGACAHSSMAVFSFHASKVITTGEGGAVTTNDPNLYQRMVRFRNHGMIWMADSDGDIAKEGESKPWYYEMEDIGFNFRMTDFQAALGCSQLKKLEQFSEKRRYLISCYDRELKAQIPDVSLIPKVAGCIPAWHLSIILVDYAAMGVSRSKVMQAMKAQKIGTQVHYIPVNSQPYYRRLYGDLQLAGAQAYYDRTLSLPLFPNMEDEDVKTIVGSLKHALFQ